MNYLSLFQSTARRKKEFNYILPSFNLHYNTFCLTLLNYLNCPRSSGLITPNSPRKLR